MDLFEPDEPNDLVRGWLLHAHKGRDRHDLAARRCDQRRYLVGIPAVVTSAIVGTSTFAALQGSPSRQLEADFVTSGPSPRLERTTRGLLQSRDRQIFWEVGAPQVADEAFREYAQQHLGATGGDP